MATTLTAVPYPYTEGGWSNLATNPSVETATTDWGFTAGTGGTATGARLGPFTGGVHAPLGVVSAYFWRAAWTVATTAIGGGINYSLLTSITPGLPYSAALSYRCTKAQRLRLDFSWRTAANAVISTDVGAEFVATAGVWAQVTMLNKVAPATAGRLVITLYALAGTGATNWAAGDYLDGDNLRITALATIAPQGYFDGDTSSAGLVAARYSWGATAHASASFLLTRAPTVAASQVTPELVTVYEARRQSRTVLHDVIGRPDPLPALGPLGARTGRLEVWCSTEAQAHAVVALYALGGVVMLKDPDHLPLEMYHVGTATDVAPDRTINTRWIVSVDYAEVYGTAALW